MDEKNPEPRVTMFSMRLVLTCVECGTQVRAPFTGERLYSRNLFQETGWVLSLIDPNESCLAPVCPECTLKLYGPEMMEAVRKKFTGGDAN